MAYLAINGYELPPCKRGVSVVVTTVVDSGRDANGAVVGQRVGRDQYKIDGLEWAWLTAAQWERILSILSNFFVYVEFNDPVTNKRKTVRMWSSFSRWNGLTALSILRSVRRPRRRSW